jgi:glycosyltransferase involved in cell wall biosynthesis
MKILIISNLYPPNVLGGYEILCGQVCAALRDRGHKVAVLCSDHGISSGGTTEENIFRELRLYLPFDQPARLLRWRRRQIGRENYLKAEQIIEREQPDVIFVWSQLRLTLGAARAAENSGIPVVYTFNDEHLAGYAPKLSNWGPRQMLGHLVDHTLLRRNTLASLKLENSTCISQMVKDRLLSQNVLIPAARVIYQGIPIEQFPLKAEPGSLHEPARLLYVGQLHAYKGVHTLIRAAHQAAPEVGNGCLHLTIVGDGDASYVRELKALASNGPAEVTLGGRVSHSQVARVYRSHDVLIFPSIWKEPFGLTHIESMASGTPVISTANGGQGEFLIDGVNALLFEEENESQLKQNILKLTKNPRMSRDLALQARQTVENRFTLTRYLDDLEDLVVSVAARRVA